MRKCIVYTLALFISITSFAQVTSEKRAAYEQLLEKNTRLFDKAVNKEENQEVLNRFNRLKSLAEGEWLPLYYAALTRMYLKDQVDRNKDVLIDDAIRDLKAAQAANDNSEVKTLLARAYLHKVELNNGAGPKYIPLIKSLLNEAIKIDESNPRAFLIYGNFYLNFPNFVGGDEDKAKMAFEKADNLYAVESKNLKMKYTALPHWGKGWNDNFLAHVNK